VELVHWADRVEPAEDLVNAVAKLLHRPADIGLPGCAVVQGLHAAGFPGGAGGRAPVFRRPTGQILKVETDLAISAFLVFNESYNRGWRAAIDGKATPIRRVDAVCQGVWVPAGRHTLRFEYWPRGQSGGIAVSAVGVVLLAAGLAATARRSLT
jgi:hypothetical protein